MIPMTIQFGDSRLPARFWAKVTPEPNSGCWLWMAGCDLDGYGRFKHEGRTSGAHRIAYSTLVGPVAEGLQCDHQCWVRCCVNPNHIKLTTPQGNSDNMSVRGKSAQIAQGRAVGAVYGKTVGKLYGGKWPGEACSTHKLTNEQVLEIRDLYAKGGSTQQVLGVRFGVSQVLIGLIVNRKAWKHI
jgi:hypothetical protein